MIRPVFDVVEFGADRTGSTDSSTAIQSAVDRASASGGGLVWLPRGTFRVGVPAGKSAALTVAADHVVLRGAGAGRTRLINHTASMRDRSVVCFDSDPRPRRAGIGFSPIPLGEDIEGPWTEITLTDVSGLSVGSEIVLRADATV
ncbi:MAG: glycosyl hydrolase family 28-related protein, partial [Armatimonadaceae bacterium]